MANKDANKKVPNNESEKECEKRTFKEWLGDLLKSEKTRKIGLIVLDCLVAGAVSVGTAYTVKKLRGLMTYEYPTSDRLNSVDGDPEAVLDEVVARPISIPFDAETGELMEDADTTVNET